MTEQEIIQDLIARDDKITAYFFFTRCQPSLLHTSWTPGKAHHPTTE